MPVRFEHGNGQTQARPGWLVGRDERTAAQPWASFLLAPESSLGSRGLRRLRGVAVPQVLRTRAGSSEPGAGPLLPPAAGRLLRGLGLRAWHGLAGGGF